MPELKKYELYNDCDDVKFEFDLYYDNTDNVGKTECDLEWIPYRMKLTVDKETYRIIDGFSLNRKMIEVWIEKMQELIKEREKFTYFDKSIGKSISTVPDSEKEKVLMEYQPIDCCWGEELEFEIYMQNTEDYRDDIIVLFEIWLKSAVITDRRQGYSIGFRFSVKYDDIRAFCDCLKKQYEEIISV